MEKSSPPPKVEESPFLKNSTLQGESFRTSPSGRAFRTSLQDKPP